MFNLIRPNFYIGSGPDSQDASAIRAVGITAILNVASEENDAPIDGVLMMKVGLSDGPKNPPAEISRAISAAVDLMQSHVLCLHCHCGQSRAPYIGARALMLREGLSFADAFAEILRCRPIVEVPNRLAAFYGIA